MFLKKTIEENPELIRAGFELHQSGRISPDSYVIDLDQLLENAGHILEKADKNGIRLFFMLKQLGRNPYIAKELLKIGYPGAVAVDFKEAELMMKYQIPLGNVGHLVQIPEHMVKSVVEYGAEVITVYSLDKVRTIDQAAKSCGKIQKILLRVYDSSDLIYSGQTAGIHLNHLEEMVSVLSRECKNIKVAGVTSFPCYLFNEEKGEIEATKNLDTVQKGVEILKACGIDPEYINTPSSTCCSVLDLMKNDGANCGEPGHGITGTTPAHVLQSYPEKPCVLYLSEISHNFMGKGYCYGGGHYRRSHLANALVGRTQEDAEIIQVNPPASESIDYHFELENTFDVGNTVIMAFRYQIFTTRSDVVLLGNIKSGQPEILGIYDSLGNKK